jgi:hypothetical protein
MTFSGTAGWMQATLSLCEPTALLLISNFGRLINLIDRDRLTSLLRRRVSLVRALWYAEGSVSEELVASASRGTDTYMSALLTIVRCQGRQKRGKALSRYKAPGFERLRPKTRNQYLPHVDKILNDARKLEPKIYLRKNFYFEQKCVEPTTSCFVRGCESQHLRIKSITFN